MADQRAFVEKFDFNFPLLADVDGAIGRAYGALEGDGRIPARVSFLIGPDGTIAKVYSTVDPATHPAEVLADLRERLQASTP